MYRLNDLAFKRLNYNLRSGAAQHKISRVKLFEQQLLEHYILVLPDSSPFSSHLYTFPSRLTLLTLSSNVSKSKRKWSVINALR